MARYWDGTAWTDDRRSMPETQAPDPAPTPKPTPRRTAEPELEFPDEAAWSMPVSTATRSAITVFRPWYLHPVVVVIGLMFCLPIGLVLLWQTSWNRGVKVGLSIFVLLVTVGGAIARAQDQRDQYDTLADYSPGPTYGPWVSSRMAEEDDPYGNFDPWADDPGWSDETEWADDPGWSDEALPSTTTTALEGLDEAVMCRTALADPDVMAAFNACTGEQYDLLMPLLAPQRPLRAAVCGQSYAGVACEGIPVTVP